MVVGETKVDDSYPASQFNIAGYSEPFRLDRDKHGGGLLIYVRVFHVSSYNNTIPDDIEGRFIELNFRKNSWLLFGTYHPPIQNDEYFFCNVGNAFGTCTYTYIRTYKKCILAGDFNDEVSETKMENFLGRYGLSSLINDKTCSKS